MILRRSAQAQQRWFSTVMNGTTTLQRKKVAVIGSGPGGIGAAQQLLSVNKALGSPKFSITVFERRNKPGGVWTYDSDPGPCVVRFDKYGKAYPLWSQECKKDGDDQGRFRPPGPMYEGLRTNLPCDIMNYRSLPYDANTDLFPVRKTVEDYTAKIAQRLYNDASDQVQIRYATAVNRVERISHDPSQGYGSGSRWSVKSVHVETGKELEEVYDNIVLASGRCNTPTVPYIEGLWNFRGQILHSAWWRSPIPFEGKTVLVVGNSSSGSDIARELVGYVLRTLPEGEKASKRWIEACRQDQAPSKVLHSYEHIDKSPPLDYDPRDPESPDWAKKIQVLPKMSRVEPPTQANSLGKVIFEDGTERNDIDVIIFGTGYSYDYPYLDQSAAPFTVHPMIPHPPVKNDSSPAGLDNFFQRTDTTPYRPPYRVAPFLTNLDDWSIFYQPDPSICVLGAPYLLVPYPLMQVQSRIAAAFWAGLLGDKLKAGLPKLDRTIPTNLPERWTSYKELDANQASESGATEARETEPNKTSELGHPSDTAYQNALLDLLPDILRTRGADEDLSVPKADGDKNEVDAELKPVVPEDEGWAVMPTFRNERRQDGKRLRRLCLGY